ncbi:MAG: hypothetical protein LBR15_03010 [Methanobrevibacter sp.]|jgi:hypothetical protein|nr:hypothetical protein [Candidatus Methanovirga australis]
MNPTMTKVESCEGIIKGGIKGHLQICKSTMTGVQGCYTNGYGFLSMRICMNPMTLTIFFIIFFK